MKVNPFMRLTLIVALLAISAGMIVYSVKSVRYRVDGDQMNEFTMNLWSLSEGVVRDSHGNLAYRDAMINLPNKPYVQVACADLSVAISAMQTTAVTATPAKKPAVKKSPANASAAKKPAAKAPAAKKPAAKTPPKAAPKKPNPNADCPT